MHVNSAEQSIICKLCYAGPAGVGKGELLTHLYRHFAASQGEHTAFESRRFAPRAELAETMSDDEVEAFVANAESAMDASYDELVDSGELVWFRARLAEATAADQFAVHVDAFTVSGEADQDHLWAMAMQGADCVVFVADPDDREATVDAWATLQSDWKGPVVLFVHGSEFTDEVEEWLGFEGEALAESDGFEHTKLAFETAAKVALRHARASN